MINVSISRITVKGATLVSEYQSLLMASLLIHKISIVLMKDERQPEEERLRRRSVKTNSLVIIEDY